MPEIQRVSECQNCGVPLAGPYCSQCGQRGRYGRLRLGQIIHDLREDLVCGDFSFMQTVKGMALAPGRTCQEYVQGKRKKLVNPLKFCFWTLALLISCTYFLGLEMDLGLSDTVLDDLGDEELQRSSDLTSDLVLKHIKTLFFFAVPVFALFLFLLFRRKGFNFTEVFSAVLLVSGQLNIYKIIILPLAFLSRPLAVNVELVMTALYTTWFLISFFRLRVWQGILLAPVAAALYVASISAIIIPFTVVYLVWLS